MCSAAWPWPRRGAGPAARRPWRCRPTGTTFTSGWRRRAPFPWRTRRRRGARPGWPSDGYDHGPETQLEADLAGERVLLIDDHGRMGVHGADLVVDQNLGTTPAHYPLTDARLLLGPTFALLREPFRHPVADADAPVLVVTMGGSPSAETAAFVAETLALVDLDPADVAVVGDTGVGDAAALRTKRGSGVHSLTGRHDLAGVLAGATVALSAAGSTAWELCCTGTAAVLVSVADNQEPVADALAAAGVARHLGRLADADPHEAAEALTARLDDPSAREEAVAIGRRLVDGHGADRVVTAMRAAGLQLRPACLDDGRLLFDWVNDPAVRASAFDEVPIDWETHERWFQRRLADPGTTIYLAVDPGTDEPVGPSPLRARRARRRCRCRGRREHRGRTAGAGPGRTPHRRRRGRPGRRPGRGRGGRRPGEGRQPGQHRLVRPGRVPGDRPQRGNRHAASGNGCPGLSPPTWSVAAAQGTGSFSSAAWLSCGVLDVRERPAQPVRRAPGGPRPQGRVLPAPCLDGVASRPTYGLGALPDQGGTLWSGLRLHELYAEVSTPWEWHDDLAAEADRLGLDRFSTLFDTTALDFLEERDPVCHRIASFELVDIPLIRGTAATARPLIISTGMSTAEGIEDAVKAATSSGDGGVMLLRCNSGYPADPAEMDLLACVPQEPLDRRGRRQGRVTHRSECPDDPPSGRPAAQALRRGPGKGGSCVPRNVTRRWAGRSWADRAGRTVENREPRVDREILRKPDNGSSDPRRMAIRGPWWRLSTGGTHLFADVVEDSP